MWLNFGSINLLVQPRFHASVRGTSSVSFSIIGSVRPVSRDQLPAGDELRFGHGVQRFFSAEFALQPIDLVHTRRRRLQKAYSAHYNI